MFAGELSNILRFRKVQEFSDGEYPSIIGVCDGDYCKNPQVVIVSRDNSTGKYGFSQFYSNYISPLMRGAESQVYTELYLGHCVRQ